MPAHTLRFEVSGLKVGNMDAKPEDFLTLIQESALAVHAGYTLPEGLSSEHQALFKELEDFLAQCPSDYIEMTVNGVPLFFRLSKNYTGQRRYHIQGDLLGQGGFGSVYDLPYVIKIDADGKITDIKKSHKVVKMFNLTEKGAISLTVEKQQLTILGTQSRKRKTDTAKVHGCTHYLISSKVEGLELEKMPEWDFNHSMSSSTKLMLSYQLLLDLVYIHQLGFVHGDVKPGNAMVDESGKRAQWIDYGLVKKIGTQKKHYEGTSLYSKKDFYLNHSQGVYTYTTQFDSIGLACCLSKILGWGDPTDESDWAKDLADMRVEHHVVPSRIQQVAKSHPVFPVFEKLISSSSVNPYTAEQALKDMQPIVYSHFFNTKLAVLMEQLNNRQKEWSVQKRGETDFIARLSFLHEIQVLLAIPKDASPIFINRRWGALDEFLIDNDARFTEYDCLDIKNLLMDPQLRELASFLGVVRTAIYTTMNIGFDFFQKLHDLWGSRSSNAQNALIILDHLKKDEGEKTPLAPPVKND